MLEEEAGNMLQLIGTEKDFLNKTPAAWALGSIIEKWDYEIKKPARQQRTSSFKERGSLQNGKNLCQSYGSGWVNYCSTLVRGLM